MSTAADWKRALAERIPEPLAREIDVFESEVEARKHGRIDEKVFAETRLRRGAYGQRYDNGQRHDGVDSRKLPFPSGELTKGPSTLWDAPGMQRIKIPFGRVTCEQLEALADVAEEHSDGILHVTTRQDFQLHFVHIEETPTIMRRLAAVGITTREACGNTVRNVTACHLAGVCRDESFDVTPYANVATWFLLGHPDTQDFGRKFKVAFSGCAQHACSLTALHDFGCIARVASDGARGFEVYVGGGLGAVPQQAKLLYDFLPTRELLPIAQAVARLFARLGEKKNRQRARLKFVVAKLGIEEFKRLVDEERAKLTPDPRWTDFLEALEGPSVRAAITAAGGDELAAGSLDRPLRPPAPLTTIPDGEPFSTWKATNTQPQRQAGYVVATARLPLGDLTSDQARGLADLARRFVGDAVRTTVEQNIVLRWVSEADLPELHRGLAALGLAQPGAGTIADVTACPGTDTCKLGISSSRGLAAELEHHLAGVSDPAVKNLHIKTSGCFNACGQHHVADLGFLGVSRNVGGRRVPHFQLVVGGQWTHNAAAYGLAIGALPSKRIPEVVDRVTARFIAERQEAESFQDWVRRTGKGRIRALVEDLLEVPSYGADPSFYRDWGDVREYTIGDMGVGECAGEVVSPAQFGLAASEREAFEAQLKLDDGAPADAGALAYRAMLTAARALLGAQNPSVPEDADGVVRLFRARIHETQLFNHPLVGDKFAQYLLRYHEAGGTAPTAEAAHQRIEEAQLFIEAAHACYDRMVAAPRA